jgi:hypothetical protein
LTHRWLDFAEAVVIPDPYAGTFTARLGVPGPVVDGRALTGFTGRWVLRGGIVATAITVLAAAGERAVGQSGAGDRTEGPPPGGR